MKIHLTILTLAILLSCGTDTRTTNDTTKFDAKLLLGKWKKVGDTLSEYWISEDKMFFGVRNYVSGQGTEQGGVGIIIGYIVKDGLWYETLNGKIPPGYEGKGMQIVKYSSDTLGFVSKDKTDKIYRIEKEIPKIEDNEAWKKMALEEINSRSVK